MTKSHFKQKKKSTYSLNTKNQKGNPPIKLMKT